MWPHIILLDIGSQPQVLPQQQTPVAWLEPLVLELVVSNGGKETLAGTLVTSSSATAAATLSAVTGPLISDRSSGQITTTSSKEGPAPGAKRSNSSKVTVCAELAAWLETSPETGRAVIVISTTAVVTFRL